MQHIHRVRVVLIYILILSSIAVGMYYWYFCEVVHQQALSPDGRWKVIVTKRMKRFPEPVVIMLKMIDTHENGTVMFNCAIGSPDCWRDVKIHSYRIEWISNSELTVWGKDNEDSSQSYMKNVKGDWVAR